MSLHFEFDPGFLRRFAQFGKSRSTTGGSHEVNVAATAHAALRHYNAFAVVRQVGNEFARFARFFEVFAHHRAHGNFENQVFAARTVHAAATAMRAARCLEMVLVAVVDQRRNRSVCF